MKMMLAHWLALGCVLLLVMTDQQAVGSHLLVADISDEGSIKREIVRIKLPHIVRGKSDMVVRDNHIYICSHERLYILKQSVKDTLELTSSFPLKGNDFSLAMHSKISIAYIIDEKSIAVVNVKDVANPELAQYLSLTKEIGKIPQDIPIMNPAGTDIACEGDKLVVAVEFLTATSGISGAVLVFDISEPLAPQIERILNCPTGAASVDLGLCDHQMLVVGEKVLQYRNFIEDRPEDSEFNPDRSWLRKPDDDPKRPTKIEVPGRVVETQLLLGAAGDSHEMVQTSIDQYRHADASECERLRYLVGLDHGFLYVATEHALARYHTPFKYISWRRTTIEKGVPLRNVSDRFDRLYGLAMRGYKQAYLAAGKSGVYVLNERFPFRTFVTHTRYKNVPGPVLDVCVADDKLYILCGE